MRKLNKPILMVAIVGSLALTAPAEAGNRQVKNTISGAAIGAGVGVLVGGSKSVATGAIVGAIAGAVK